MGELNVKAKAPRCSIQRGACTQRFQIIANTPSLKAGSVREAARKPAVDLGEIDRMLADVYREVDRATARVSALLGER